MVYEALTAAFFEKKQSWCMVAKITDLSGESVQNTRCAKLSGCVDQVQACLPKPPRTQTIEDSREQGYHVLYLLISPEEPSLRPPAWDRVVRAAEPDLPKP